jgi:hypothetical protein
MFSNGPGRPGLPLGFESEEDEAADGGERRLGEHRQHQNMTNRTMIVQFIAISPFVKPDCKIGHKFSTIRVDGRQFDSSSEFRVVGRKENDSCLMEDLDAEHVHKRVSRGQVRSSCNIF